MASILDVSAMKINAVVGRGTKKDFYDINELLKLLDLREMLDAYQEKYQMDNTAMAESSLLYFEDARNMDNRDNQVVILDGSKWSEVKRRIKDEYVKYRKDIGRNTGQGFSM